MFAGVELRGRGRERHAACVLHGGDNPRALGVNVGSLRWHCRTRCGGGDALAWIAARAGLCEPGASPRGAEFAEAVRLAAALVGLTPPDGSEPSPDDRARLQADAARRLEAAADADAARSLETAEHDAGKRAAARRLWESAEPDAPIVARYLARRRCWPPPAAAEALGLPSTPARVRWATGPQLAACGVRLGRLPPSASGAAVYAYAPIGGGVAALQLDALTADGQHAAPRWRRAIGSREGLVFRVRGRAGADGWTAICEGEATAIAVAAAADVAEARAVGGHAGLTLAAASGASRVWLVGDADVAGRGAVAKLAAELEAAGVAVRVAAARGEGGRDFADALDATIAEAARGSGATLDGGARIGGASPRRGSPAADPLAAAWWGVAATPADRADAEWAEREAALTAGEDGSP